VKEQQTVVRMVREDQPVLNGDDNLDPEEALDAAPPLPADIRTEPARRFLWEDKGWEDEDVAMEAIQPGRLVEPKRNANWKCWWRDWNIKDYA
jgi:hypothetical protein